MNTQSVSVQPAPIVPRVTYSAILKLAAPLVLSMSGVVIMQFIDALFLSWYSADAIAAVVPAFMPAFLLSSALTNTAAYTSTFVAQYKGAGRPERMAGAVWQGIYFSVASGALMAFVSLAAVPLFAWIGHAPAIQTMEVRFFSIMCWGAFFFVAANAVSGFFSGRGETGIVMAVNLGGLFANAVFDYVLIFGKFGFPRLGITGAALATVSAQALVALMFTALFLRRPNRERWATWRARRFDGGLFARLVRFGLPGGLRFSLEMAAWTVFVFYIGRIGAPDLAATNIAWRINGIAIFPVMGLSQAVAILVGNAQGAGRPDASTAAAWRGTALSQAWMLVMAAMFVAFPESLFGIFAGKDPASEQFLRLGPMLLRFVAVYCLLDAFNYVFVGTLVAAGDTRWTLYASIALNAAFVVSLAVADVFSRTLFTEWALATIFVMIQAVLFLIRFLQGKWRDLRVVESQME
jgi:multidrug resistance protein, MATE family